MKLFRITYKLVALSFLAVIAVPVMFFYSFSSDETAPNAKQKAYRKKWLRTVVKVIGLKLQVISKDADNAHQEQSSLWVANHISWMDIAVVGSQGVGFLSKSEVRKWPVIGWLGDKGGTVFIERGGKNASQLAGKAIAEKITAGDNILVFPEGTTGSGENVKRFHARIFAPAIDHKLKVQPIAIQYLDENGRLHPNASWDDQNFFNNLMGVLSQNNIRVVLTFLPILNSEHYQERRHLATHIENQIRDIVLSTSAVKIA